MRPAARDGGASRAQGGDRALRERRRLREPRALRATSSNRRRSTSTSSRRSSSSSASSACRTSCSRRSASPPADGRPLRGRRARDQPPSTGSAASSAPRGIAPRLHRERASPAPMHAMPGPFAPASGARRTRASSSRSAITGIANMLSDAVPAGSQRRIAIHSRKPIAVATSADVAAAAARARRSTASPGVEQDIGSDHERNHADEHLPRDEVERVELAAALEVLRRDRARRPPEPRQHRPQLGREVARQCHGSTTSVRPASAKRDRRPTARRARARAARATR